MGRIKKNFLVVSDYNWLPQNIEESWVHKYTDNYIIYDRAHRWPETDRVKRQKNVGQNTYDMFDFIVTHYDNLPDATIFCRAAIFYPKGIIKPNGTCSVEKFESVMNNETFTELHDFGPEAHTGGLLRSRIANFFRTGKFLPTSKMAPDGGFLEINNSWYFRHFKGKYFHNLNDFLKEVYVNPVIPEYIRFAPGASYILPKATILKYSKNFYEKMREYIGWNVLTGEAHMFERALYTMFTCNYEVRDKYK